MFSGFEAGGKRPMALDQVEAMAALGFDRFAHDDADREAGRRIACPSATA